MSVKNKNESARSWIEIQDRLASESGLAIALVMKPGLETIAESNNNSICSVLSKSGKFSAECAKFCGRVHEQSLKTEQPFRFKCHAGLECVAVPLAVADGERSTAIVGRAFTKAEDYRIATNKAIDGEWSEFAPSTVFENVLLTGSQSVELLAKKIAAMDHLELESLKDLVELSALGQESGVAASPDPVEVPKDVEVTPENTPAPEEKGFRAESNKGLRLPRVSELTRNRVIASPIRPRDQILSGGLAIKAASEDASTAELEEQVLWRSLFGDIQDLSYIDACKLILNFLRDHYAIGSMAWLENHGNRLTTIFAIGKLKSQKIQISVAMDDPRLRKLLRDEDSIELRERGEKSSESQAVSIRLFPIKFGTDIRSALVLQVSPENEKLVAGISRFCRTIASELEILRLREELSRRSWIDIALKKFNESLRKIDTDDFWIRLMQTTAELLQAERGSLLIYDEKSESLKVKAAIGRKADLLKTDLEDLGRRVAHGVWEKGEALVVSNIGTSAIEAAPADWNYLTGSFISYPLVIGERHIGVLNVADKVDGTPYGEKEVQILNSIIPQIAVAADRANLKNKAGEYEQLSVTDPLTGLLNRRYLEERLAEEIKRSGRHGYPMSFMMIDVDDFKSYNDQFLHPEGDKALKIVGFCLRETLRGADVAARYGGEEFSILLPQTSIHEAKTIAERIRGNIESAEFPHRQVTVSIGIATISAEIDSVEKLIEGADRALFAAKREGKNQVHVFESETVGQSASIH